ncbi:MAG: NTP transferase domain-containing protein [Treponema sp.]|jgi:mannose-1-phosphate guanylyltransferase/mannose-1-phosphate guanylyltransferase/mannose-6-phosphate isomerase|nr:NTP transferase domain-containing protein [Treponema sp.]
MFSDCIIMAGGSGSRLWPASNSHTPKQFLAVEGASKPGRRQTFFNMAVDRALAVTGRGNVIIVAGRAHAARIIAACEAYSKAARGRIIVIPEPLARNTAPAIACALTYVSRIGGGDRTLLVLASDHVIGPPETFKADAAAAFEFARAGKLAIFGVKPKQPETGYGYIETGLSVSDLPGPLVFAVKAFHEKPNLATAKKYLKAGTFFWNSGMFAFSSGFMLNQFARNAPEVIAPFDKLRAPGPRSFKVEKGMRILQNWPGLKAAYSKAGAISFDYAIAEKCAQTVMVGARFNWTDAGSWDEYALLAEASAKKQGAKGAEKLFQVNAKNCYVDSDLSVALIDVDDLVVVVRSGKNGAVLVAKRGETQKVRDIVEQIKASGRSDLL